GSALTRPLRSLSRWEQTIADVNNEDPTALLSAPARSFVCRFRSLEWIFAARFRKFFSAGVTSPFVARAMRTGGCASVVLLADERAGVCQPCDCLFVSCLASEP